MPEDVLDPVFQPLYPGHRRARGATIVRAVALDSVTDDLAAAMGAFRCECMDRALERVESMSAIRHRDRERLVVVVAADFARCHRSL